MYSDTEIGLANTERLYVIYVIHLSSIFQPVYNNCDYETKV